MGGLANEADVAASSFVDESTHEEIPRGSAANSEGDGLGADLRQRTYPVVDHDRDDGSETRCDLLGSIRGVGDYFQWIVDVEVTEAQAEEVADRLRRWLVDRGVIVPEETLCAISSPGHRPGSNFLAALGEHEVDSNPDHMDGVEIHIGRTLFYPGQGEVGPADCPVCDHTFGEVTFETFDQWGDDPQIDELVAAAGRWVEGGSAEVRCSECGNSAHLNDWGWGYGALAVGHVGITFWNWPPLAEGFARQVSEVLGHRVRDGLPQKL